jgi:Ca2+-binding RTX toxin-like protein
MPFLSPLIEPLESRRLMSATITGTQTITIVCDDTPTTVQINVLNTRFFTITVDGGAPVQYSLSRARAVRFFGGAGDDTFRINSITRDPANGIPKSVLFNRRTAIFGRDGNDTLIDGYAHSRIDGGNGNDLIFGGGGNDRLVGGAGDDTIIGGPHPDEANTKDGNDIIFGGSGNDSLSGGRGRDTLFGQDGDDFLSGGTSRDALHGMSGNDTLDLGTDRDIVYTGGQPDDILISVEGDDFVKRRDLPNLSRYLSRIIREYIPNDMYADVRA